MKNTLKMSEHQLQTLIKNYLEAKGWYVIRLNSGAIRTDKGNMVRLARRGTPDLLVFKNRQSKMNLWFIEVKVYPNKTTPAQDFMLDELQEYGANTLVAYCLEDVENNL